MTECHESRMIIDGPESRQIYPEMTASQNQLEADNTSWEESSTGSIDFCEDYPGQCYATELPESMSTSMSMSISQQPESQQPESPQPESQQPESQQPESQQPESPQPESQQPESPQPESQQPESQQPESPQPESQQPESPQPESQQPESPSAESQRPESPSAESQRPESQQPESPEPESQQPESPSAESQRPESPQPEAQRPESPTPESNMIIDLTKYQCSKSNIMIDLTDIPDYIQSCGLIDLTGKFVTIRGKTTYLGDKRSLCKEFARKAPMSKKRYFAVDENKRYCDNQNILHSKHQTAKTTTQILCKENEEKVNNLRLQARTIRQAQKHLTILFIIKQKRLAMIRQFANIKYSIDKIDNLVLSTIFSFI